MIINNNNFNIFFRCPKSKLSQRAIIKVKWVSFFVYVEVLFLWRLLILVSHLLWKRFHAKGNCPCGTENKLADKNLKYFSDGKIQCLLLCLIN